MSLENEGVEVSALGLKGAGDEATRTEEWSRSRSGDRGPKTAAEAEGQIACGCSRGHNRTFHLFVRAAVRLGHE